MKILFIRTDWNMNPRRAEIDGYGGVGYYRIIKPSQYLSSKYEIEVVGKNADKFGKNLVEMFDNIFSEFDLVWTKNIDDERGMAAMAFFSERYNKPFVVDLDDNYLDIRENQPAYLFYNKNSKTRYVLGAFLSLASAISVSTEPLREILFNHIKSVHGIDKKIFVCPNANDIKDWKFENKKGDGKKIVIGYQGSTTHDDDFMLIVNPLKSLLEEYKNLYFEVLGSFEKERWEEIKNLFGKARDRVEIKFGTYIWNDYPPYLLSQKWDIGIAPLVNDKFNICKSHIKWMEYSMKKIPTVASKVYPYFVPIDNVKIIQDGETGFLCETENDWYEKLKYLIENKKERKRIGQNAYNYIKKYWQYKDWIFKWENVIKGVAT